MIVTGCSGTGPGQEGPTAESQPAADSTAQKPPTVLEWGKSATGTGEQGQPLQITPLGVYYHKGDQAYGMPQNGVFAAISVRVATTTGADHVPPPASRHGFYWEGDGEHDGEQVDATNGEDPPWIGRVSQPTIQDIPAGKARNYVVTFDAFSRGGSLVYVSPDGGRYEWPLPARSGGKGLRPVLVALDEIGVKR
ncbi:hypothetical protein [Nonomuraea sp. NPDC003214]